MRFKNTRVRLYRRFSWEKVVGGGWREEDGGWRMEGGGWRMEGGGWRERERESQLHATLR